MVILASNSFIVNTYIKLYMRRNSKILMFCIAILILISPLISFISFTSSSSSNINTPLVLVTGFGPFHIYDTNPSELIAEYFNGSNIEGAFVRGIVLPVDFEDSVYTLIQYIEQESPDIIINLGLSPPATFIEIEKIAINLKQEGVDTRWEIPKVIDPNGPFIQISTLPTKDIAKEIQNNNINSYQSPTAGLYICNALFYGTLCYIKENNLQIKSGFIHLPPLPSQNSDGMELDQMIQAIDIAIRVCLRE